MRSTFYVILAFILLGGGFGLYWKLQPPLARAPGGTVVLTPLPLNGELPKVNGSGPGDRPWMKQIGKEGQLTSRFRAAEYQPRDGGMVHVKSVQIEMFQYFKDAREPKGRVQRIQIEGVEGDIEMPSGPDDKQSSSPFGGGGRQSNGQPKRGRLNDVVMHLFPDDLSVDPAKRRESLVLTTNNLAFDNESFEITTEAVRDRDGRVLVPADEVPIHVHGDYLFEGRGLKLRWNEVDGRLELLEIAHGDYLEILHPNDLSGGTGPKAKGGGVAALFPWGGWGGGSGSPVLATDANPAGPLCDAAGVPIALVASDKRAIGPRDPNAPPPPAVRAAKAAAQPKKNEQHHGPQPPYRATFFEDVRISQGIRGTDEREMATADLMHVDFRPGQGSGDPTTQPATQPVTKPTTGSAFAPTATADASPSTAPAEAPATAPATVADATAGATTQPDTQPSTQPVAPDQQPVIVRWSGLLRVLPVEPGGPELPLGLKAGESILRLIGSKAPVQMTRDLNRARCAAVDYYSVDGSVSMRNSASFPQVVLTQFAAPAAPGQPAAGQDATVVSEAIDYSGTSRVAHLQGRGYAHVLMKNGAAPAATQATTRPADVLDAHWTRQAFLYFIPALASHAPTPATAPSDVVATPTTTATTAPASTRPAKGGARPSQENLVIQHATFDGDVDVKHPQMALKSQLLDLTFDPPGPATRPATRPAGPSTHPADKNDKQPNLKQMIATDAVWCELKDPAGKVQDVTCEKLTMDTDLSDDGKVYPHIVHADGDAHGYDGKQDLRASHIEMTLAPTTKPSGPTTGPSSRPETATTNPAADGGSAMETAAVELRTMTAREHVRVVNADGAVASSDELYVVMVDRQPHARLVGRPNAEVVDAKQNVLIGPVITVDPKQDTATVEGPGSMHMIRQDNPASRPRPVDVTWTTGARVNGPENWVDVYGPVSVVTPDPDGTVNTANAQHVRIELADKPAPPATQPSTAGATEIAATTGGPSTRPARHKGDAAAPSDATATDAAGMNFMRDKVAKAIVLDRDAVVKSKLTDAGGGILREFDLNSTLIRYELGTDEASPTTAPASTAPDGAAPGRGRRGKLIVPAPGTMLVRDHRPPAPKTAPAAGAPPQPPDDGGLDAANNRGATAFQWTRDLTYDESTQIAVFNGDVVIVHKDDAPSALPVRLDSDQVTATFQPRAASATTKPAGTQPAGDAPAPLQLKWLTAIGRVVATRAGSTMTGRRIDFDPATSWMTATGSPPRDPATFTDPDPHNAMAADQLMWNTQSWQVKAHNMSSSSGGSSKPPATPKKR